MFAIARDVFIFVMVTAGLALPLAHRARNFDPLERLTIGLAASVTLVGLFSFLVYILRLDPRWHWLLAAAAVGGGLLTWRPAKPWLQTGELAQAGGSWFLFAAWSLGLATLVSSYSGGAWAGDWYEHYERTLFFVWHWPKDHLFIDIYPVTARPPLGNLATGAFLALTDERFARFQVFALLLNTLVFFPVALFVRSWGGGARAAAWAALGLMLNPSIAENVTFGWTKLIAAFFTATGVYFLWRDIRSPSNGSVRAGGCALAAALLTHYSAGPWILAFVPAWLWQKRTEWRKSGFWRNTLLTGMAAALLLAAWFGWAVANFGWAGTLAANTSVVALAPMGWGEMARAFLVKLGCTLVPHPLRLADLPLIAQTNVASWFRDYFFEIYQVNLPFVFGSAGLFLLARAWLLRLPDGRTPPLPAERSFWWIGVVAVIVLGVAVHGETDRIGLAHICLQPLLAVGLAAGLARLARESERGASGLLWPALAMFWAVDAFVGIALHFAAQAFALGASTPPDIAAYAHGLDRAAQTNFSAKLRLAQPFLHDTVKVPSGMVALFLAGLVVIAARRAIAADRTRASPSRIAQAQEPPP